MATINRAYLTTNFNSGYDSYMPSAITQAQAAGKKLIVEEWGSLVGSGRTANLNSNVSAFESNCRKLYNHAVHGYLAHCPLNVI
jgi:hypothetical protein